MGLDKRLAKEIWDFKEAEFHLKQSKPVGNTIQTANSQFRPKNVLKADGSNFGNWYRNLAEVARPNLKGPRFFFEECHNSTYKKIGQAVLIASIHQSLVAEMQALPTCFAMYTALVAKFKTSSRAAQMNIFYKFRNFRLDPDCHNTGVASVLRDLHAEWMAVNVAFGINAYLSFVLQAADDKKGRFPTFEAIMTALDICKDQHKHAVDAAANASSSFTSANPPTALKTSAVETDHFNVSAFLADVDEANWVDALDFYALTAHKCWKCGGKNHYAKNCPDRAQPRQPDRRVGHPIGTIVGTIYGRLPSGVLLDSGRFPQTNFCRPVYPPSRSQFHARGLVDHYRPRYQSSTRPDNQSNRQSNSTTTAQGNGGVTAHIVEVNGLPDDLDDLDFHSMALGEDLVSEVAICDTGASHGFTGSKALLHDF
ncbi:hypothetical protein PTTG_30344 [Puccinia triticina 1-1 BBBD Race 1]|uniref:CCHC-type domain-containing protein n=1 Tax=Puccinia triticina (isolate 1-1 / race 1 (BBBD)) TaxID=630390 RepID=A0A180FZ46_PUCT1|nr:hypothetical protein PTTG_30344 [Puccinia triticina 1-1 BBBD Race 1]